MNEGQTFELLCRMSQFNAPKWTKNELPISESNRISFNNRIGIEMTRIEIITVTNASTDDSGLYRCNSFSRAFHRLDVIPSVSQTPEYLPDSDIVFEEIKEENSTVLLKCQMVSESDENTEILWYSIHFNNNSN